MPKSFVGPDRITSVVSNCPFTLSLAKLEGLTARVVAGCEQNTTRRLAKANDMAGCGSREDSVLADEKLLDAIRGTDLGNQLDHLGVPESTIATDDEESAWRDGRVLAWPLFSMASCAR